MFRFLNEPSSGGVGVAFTDRWGGVSSASFGTLNLGRTDHDRAEDVVENYRRVRNSLNVNSIHVVHQVHGTAAWRVGRAESAGWSLTSPVGDAIEGQKRIPVGDIIWTDVPGAAMAIRVADCVPVLIAAPEQGIVAAVHAGRVGLLSGVIRLAVETLRANGAESLKAWLGPHICGNCYEVSSEMAEHAAAIIPEAVGLTTWGTPSIDLTVGTRSALSAAGVAEVEVVSGCTRTDSSLFSHRRDPRAGRQVGIIWLAL